MVLKKGKIGEGSTEKYLTVEKKGGKGEKTIPQSLDNYD